MKVINCALFEDSEEVDAVFENFIACKHVAKALCDLDDNLLNSKQNYFFLIRVMRIAVALKHGLQKWTRLESFARRHLFGRKHQDLHQSFLVLQQFAHSSQSALQNVGGQVRTTDCLTEQFENFDHELNHSLVIILDESCTRTITVLFGPRLHQGR